MNVLCFDLKTFRRPLVGSSQSVSDLNLELPKTNPDCGEGGNYIRRNCSACIFTHWTAPPPWCSTWNKYRSTADVFIAVIVFILFAE